MTPTTTQSSRSLLIVAWLIVGVPGIWGVSQTLLKSLDLFRDRPTTNSTPATQTTTQPTTNR